MLSKTRKLATSLSVIALTIGPILPLEYAIASSASEAPTALLAQATMRRVPRPIPPGAPSRSPAVTPASGLPDLAPRIDPNDPHRLSINGASWYLAGYYASLGALSTDQTDYSYYKLLIDTLSQNGVNYFRAALNMGQAYGDAMTVYERTGPGTAHDGRPQFDLNQFNETYFNYWRDVVLYAQSRGVVVQICMTDGWHTTAPVVEDNGQYRTWGLLYDFYYSGNNVNGVNVTSRGDLFNLAHPVRAYQVALLHKMVDTLGDLPNIVWEIGNETGETAWEVTMADEVTAYERARQVYHHLVMPRDLPGHQQVPGQCDNDPAKAHQGLVAAFHQNLVLISDNDCIGPDTSDVRRHKAWAALTAGAQVDIFHFDMFDPNVLTSDDAKWGMAYIGMPRKFLIDLNVELTGMVPLDNAVTNGWALGRPGVEYVIYLPNGGTTSVPGLLNPQSAIWFNPRDGGWMYAGPGPQYTTPDGNDWVLHLVQ